MLQSIYPKRLFAYMLDEARHENKNYYNPGASFLAGTDVKGPAFICKSEKGEPQPLTPDEVAELSNYITHILRENRLCESFFDYDSVVLSKENIEEKNDEGNVVKKERCYYIYNLTFDLYEYTGKYDQAYFVETVYDDKLCARIHKLPMDIKTLDAALAYAEEKKEWSRYANRYEVYSDVLEKLPLTVCLIEKLIFDK